MTRETDEIISAITALAESMGLKFIPDARKIAAFKRRRSPHNYEMLEPSHDT